MNLDGLKDGHAPHEGRKQDEMKYSEQAETAANEIVNAFKAGSVPTALAQVFIKSNDGSPCRAWSFANQFLVAIHGTDDARGFRQWQEAGRYVKKGAKAFSILRPQIISVEAKKADGTTEKKQICTGFAALPVFRLQDTEGQELKKDDKAQAFIDSLPLVAVARAWGLKVESYTGQKYGAHGFYQHGKTVAVGVENLSTWAHEMIHAADDRLGNLTERGQHWRSETVAELGGAILLEALGFKVESDRGGAFQYIEAYAKSAGKTAAAACTEVLKRTCEAVAFLLAEADKLSKSEAK